MAGANCYGLSYLIAMNRVPLLSVLTLLSWGCLVTLSLILLKRNNTGTYLIQSLEEEMSAHAWKALGNNHMLLNTLAHKPLAIPSENYNKICLLSNTFPYTLRQSKLWGNCQLTRSSAFTGNSRSHLGDCSNTSSAQTRWLAYTLSISHCSQAEDWPPILSPWPENCQNSPHQCLSWNLKA